MVRTLRPIMMMTLISGVCYALDTTEPFDSGFSDLEFYAGYAGLDDPSSRSEVSFETLLGAGLTESFSAFVTVSVSSDGYLDQSEDHQGMGLFWTAVEGEWLDLDLYGSTGTGGGVSIGTEINCDLNGWGLQLNAEETVENAGPGERTFSTALQPLAYCRFSGGLELLGALDLLYDDSQDGGYELDWSAFSAGVNFPIIESIEGITQFDVINSGEDEIETGISVGIVAGV
ncbi:MAG: hypothetical protein JXR55_10505 [Candidatus Fermentibacteraceae bacterium]|nr:hypothetical protein [Candidatus Fermentibacteraceae bacterium]